MKLFARLAEDNIGFIDWGKYVNRVSSNLSTVTITNTFLISQFIQISVWLIPKCFQFPLIVLLPIVIELTHLLPNFGIKNLSVNRFFTFYSTT